MIDTKAVRDMLETAKGATRLHGGMNLVTLDEGIFMEALAEIDRLRGEAEAWEQTAAQHLRNENYYRGLVVSIGEGFGAAARTSDDGSAQDGVLCAKVPELVAAMRGENERLARLAVPSVEQIKAQTETLLEVWRRFCDARPQCAACMSDRESAHREREEAGRE